MKGKTARVLGAGGEFASAIAATLARESVRVAPSDIDEAALERVVGTISRDGGEYESKALDRKVGWPRVERPALSESLSRGSLTSQHPIR
ncbi:3-hydroxyacyl-CoA dehydrogenase [Bosea sp. BE125]|uniref:hypothetical protein n=1 Tax=Bosea sp. BE125 TaxID=2817909 RepID=UPI002864361B|nr:hypothetical protein [Bosea sp. BE125]MDR6870084.1 3-hydroxyacyl-CoA dehydrogenase [Bosea sp. BE125]